MFFGFSEIAQPDLEDALILIIRRTPPRCLTNNNSVMIMLNLTCVISAQEFGNLQSVERYLILLVFGSCLQNRLRARVTDLDICMLQGLCLKILKSAEQTNQARYKSSAAPPIPPSPASAQDGKSDQEAKVLNAIRNPVAETTPAFSDA
jgi:hypothetical protein